MDRPRYSVINVIYNKKIDLENIYEVQIANNFDEAVGKLIELRNAVPFNYGKGLLKHQSCLFYVLDNLNGLKYYVEDNNNAC